MADYSNITPEMAQAELARRQNAGTSNYSNITPEMAQAELARRNQVQPQMQPQAQQPQQTQQPGLLDRLLPSLPAAQNFDKGLQKAFFVPNTQGSGLAYTLGDITGNAAQFIGGGEVLNAARGASEALPYIGKIAQALGGDGLSGVARRAIGSAGYGAATNPNDIAKGAGEGAGLSAAFDAIPGVGGLISKGFNAIRPQKHAQEMLNTLGGGKGLEENAQSLAKDIQNSFENVSDEVGKIYKPIFNKHGADSIYKDLNPALSNYQSLDSAAIEGYDRNLTKLHEKFLRNPTLQNAHDLQSQLGSSVRKLEASDAKGNLSVADRSKMQGYQDARNSVRNDINTFLVSKNPKFASDYNHATEQYAQRVAPYLENSKIAGMAKGEITNPKNIANIFKNPEPETQQVINDIGSSAANKILYSELGKQKSAEKLAKSIDSLDQKGLSSYVTPEFQAQAEKLAGKIKAKTAATTLGSMLGGSAIGGHLGLPYGETLGAVGGALASPFVNSFAKKIPGGTINAQQIAKALSAGYRPVSKAIIANTVSGE